ncbi:hypothetical protein [Arundinibacter roseus]|uniref:Uncharacterized protein n=1 Tax=Arundinibacter roseus TaxID=2070510 RepID=A0A4R4K9P7_9BACT|nr:hypothetical protein [Arundinibacter roseus]TDB64554.1 hypothetical protein EZE20_12835 [Arundinibacter roseus]
MSDFEEYLFSKKIDAEKFKASESDRFYEWNTLFQQLHPESFTAQKKFLINDVRRRYLLQVPK